MITHNAAASAAASNNAEIGRAATELTETVEHEYRAWLAQKPNLQHPYAQLIVFMQAGKALAENGIGLSVLIRQVLRIFGLEAHNIEIAEPGGAVLLNDSAKAS